MKICIIMHNILHNYVSYAQLEPPIEKTTDNIQHSQFSRIYLLRLLRYISFKIQSRDNHVTVLSQNFFERLKKSPILYPSIYRVAIGSSYHGFLKIWVLNVDHVITWSRDLSEFSYFFMEHFNVIPTLQKNNYTAIISQ